MEPAPARPARFPPAKKIGRKAGIRCLLLLILHFYFSFDFFPSRVGSWADPTGQRRARRGEGSLAL